MRKRMHFVPSAVAVLIATLVLASSGSATVIKLAQFEFAGLPVTTFDGLADGTEVNGLTVDGILFNYLVDGIPTNGQLRIYGSDNFSTNHVFPPFITTPSLSGSSPPGNASADAAYVCGRAGLWLCGAEGAAA